MRAWLCSFVLSILIYPHLLLARFSLEECQTLALENSEKKTLADLRALIAYDRIDEAKSLGRLQLNAHADYMTAGDAKQVRHNKRNAHAKVAAVLPLFDFGLTLESIRSQKKLHESTLSQIDQIEQDILYAVHEAYFDLLLSQKLEWIMQDSIRSLKQHLHVTQDFLTQGLLHRNEVLVVEVQLAEFEQQALEAHFRTELAQARLNRLMGLNMDSPTEIEDILPVIKPEACLNDLIETAKLNHPELIALNAQIEAAKHGYQAEKAQLYPQIYAFSTYSTTSDYALPYRHGLDAGIGIDLNLYDGGNTYAKLRRIKKELCELEIRSQEIEKDIELNLRSSFLAIRTARSKIPVALKGSSLAEENLSLAKDLFGEGLMTNVEVVDKEENLSQARLNYYQALYSYHQARANLQYSAGIMYKKGCF